MSLNKYSAGIQANMEMGNMEYVCYLISFEAVFRRHWRMLDGVPMDIGWRDIDNPPCVPWNTWVPGTPIPRGWVTTRNGAYWGSGRPLGVR